VQRTAVVFVVAGLVVGGLVIEVVERATFVVLVAAEFADGDDDVHAAASNALTTTPVATDAKAGRRFVMRRRLPVVIGTP